jgi:cyclopropane-fatty-acyl-phospholipid synthase
MSVTASHQDVSPVAKSTTPKAAPAGWAARRVNDLFGVADVRINGSRPWDVTVHDERLFRRIVLDGAVGLGDAYVDGWWDCEAPDQLFDRLLSSGVQRHIGFDRQNLAMTLLARLTNPQSLARARRNSDAHYDLGNDLFAAMLDPTMTYTCGYWKDATTLQAAQEAKMDLICRKLGLKPGQRVLDIGCGWGSFVKFAAERYAASGVGVTISREQLDLARQRCAGLPVEIWLRDYREIDETFDHIASVGMFEHVGVKNHRTYMCVAHRALSDDGLFLLHCISASTTIPSVRAGYATWLARRVFPGATIPAMKQIGAAIDELFVVEDVQNIGADYDPTLMAWFANFDAAWPTLRERYGDRFYRMWRYYLLACAGAFRSRSFNLWQFVLSKKGVRGGYLSVR